ncbi:MAG: T9SS type A sorting domain-containing protein [Flavobacteriales bacterium]
MDWTISSYTLVPFNGCGEGPPDMVQVQGIPAPDVQYAEELGTICLGDGPQLLGGGTPAGGTYSGPGVSDGRIDPAVAGLGAHTITYRFNDGTCTGYAQAVVVVDICAGIAQGDASATRITVAPNPNDGTFTLHVGHGFSVGTVTLWGALGERVGAPRRLVPGEDRVSYAGLAPGIYTLRIEADGRVQARRVVVAGGR